MANHQEQNREKRNVIQQGLSLSDGSRMKVFDAIVLGPELIMVATGWRTSALLKVARWRWWIAISCAGIAAGWFEFAWWQFAVMAGGVVLAVKLAACVMAAHWYRTPLLSQQSQRVVS